LPREPSWSFLFPNAWQEYKEASDCNTTLWLLGEPFLNESSQPSHGLPQTSRFITTFTVYNASLKRVKNNLVSQLFQVNQNLGWMGDSSQIESSLAISFVDKPSQQKWGSAYVCMSKVPTLP
jgi:hypothetical protein